MTHTTGLFSIFSNSPWTLWSANTCVSHGTFPLSFMSSAGTVAIHQLKILCLATLFPTFLCLFFFPCAFFFSLKWFFSFFSFFFKKTLFPNSFHPDLPLFFFPSISLNFLFWSFGSFLGLSFSSNPLPSISHRSMQSSVLENPKLLCTLERPQSGWWLLESLSSLWAGELRRSCCSWVSVLG